MSNFEEAAIEPRKIYLGWLIREIGYIESLVYHSPGDCFHGLQSMRGLIDTLDANSKVQLKKEREQVESFLSTNRYQKLEVHSLWSRIMSYLMGSYLQECNLGVIPSSTLEGKGKIQAPENKPAPGRITARLGARTE